jgi:hypothetical protein
LSHLSSGVHLSQALPLLLLSWVSKKGSQRNPMAKGEHRIKKSVAMDRHGYKFPSGFEERKPPGATEEPTKAAADAGYVDCVEGVKRAEGLPEIAIRNVVARQHGGTVEATEEAERKLGTIDTGETKGGGSPEVPLTELTSWMMERSRK